jgi:hypothetical protein
MPRTNEHRAALAAIGDLADIEVALDANDLPAYLIADVTRLRDPKESARAFAFQLGLRQGLDEAFAARLDRSGVTPEDFLSAGALRWNEKGQELAEYIIERDAEDDVEDDDLDEADDKYCGRCGRETTFGRCYRHDDELDEDFDDEDDEDDDYDYRGDVNPIALVADVETADIRKAVAGLRTLLPAIADQVGAYELGNVENVGPTTTIELIPQGHTKAPIRSMPAGQLVATLTSLEANDALVYNIRIAGGIDANRLPCEPEANAYGREVTRVKLTISNENGLDLSDAAAEAGLRFALVNVTAVLGTAVVVDTDNRFRSRVYTLSLNGDGPRDARILNGACFFNAVHTFPEHGTLRARLDVA